MEHYKKAYELRLKSGIDQNITDFINNLGKAYALGGNYDEALVYYLKSLNISEQNNDLNILARTSLNIAELYALLKRYGNAVLYLENALARAEEIDDTELIMDCHLEFSKLRKDQGNYRQAMEHYEKYADLRESLIKSENEASLGDLRLNYEVLLREKEIKKLEIEKVQNEMDLQKQKSIRNYFIHSTGIAILILAGLLAGLLNNRRKNKLLQFKNDELEQANKKLVEYSEEMKKLNYAKDRLLSIISHDLRSPFNALIGFSEMLVKESERFSHQQLQTFYKGINETSKKSYELLQNLLDWTRLKTSEIPFHPMDSSLAELTENSLGLLKGSAENKEITLELDISEELRVSVDRKMFETVMRNLISNAIKYTPRGGKVIIGAERRNGSTVVFVSDTGMGMSQEQTRKLFSVEEVVSARGTENEQGSGFGLVICREFIKKHGGELTVESKPGEGSTFRIILT
jgi:signal transduction histidine kinase